MIIVLSWIGEIKNYVANQTLAQRFIVTRDEKSAARAVWINACAIVPAITLCMVVGTALFMFYSVHPERLNPAMSKPDELLPTFILHELPPGLAGIAVAAIVAASMSNSVLNSMSAVVVSDLYRPLFPRRNDQSAVRFGARFVWVAGIFGTGVAVLLAQYRIESLFDQLMELLGLFGGGLGGIFLLGIFTTRGNAAGAWAGLLVSCVVLFYVKFYTPVHVFAYLAIGMMTCFGVGYVVSAMTSRRQKNLSGLTVHTRTAGMAAAS
jgi:Na+/proline symporter